MFEPSSKNASKPARSTRTRSKSAIASRALGVGALLLDAARDVRHDDEKSIVRLRCRSDCTRRRTSLSPITRRCGICSSVSSERHDVRRCTSSQGHRAVARKIRRNLAEVVEPRGFRRRRREPSVDRRGSFLGARRPARSIVKKPCSTLSSSRVASRDS